jgi:hypothetical protein
MGQKFSLFIVLLCIVSLIIGVSVYYAVNLLTPYKESDILLESHNMNTELSFEHDEVFKTNCELGVSYSFWCYVKDWQFKYNKLKPILCKGPKLSNGTGPESLLQTNTSMPGIFLGATETVMQFTFKETDSENGYNSIYELTNIPLKSWCHIAITIYDKMVELYMNGDLIDTIYFESELNINYAPLNIAELGGFDGFICKLSVVPTILTRSNILQKYLAGPADIDVNVCSDANENANENADANENNDTVPTNTDVWSDIPYLLADSDATSDANSDVTVTEPVATFYSQPNFNNSGGTLVELPVGNYSKQDLAQYGMTPNSISGVKITDGYLVTLYVNDEPSSTDRKADYVVLRDDSDWNGALKRMNNKTKSLKIETDPYVDSLKATFYQRSNYNGWAIRLPLGKYTDTDLKIHGFNSGEISSYQILGGFQGRLYDSDFFNGEMTVIRNNSAVMDKSNKKIKSMKLEIYSDVETPKCRFFNKINYGGDAITELTYGNYNMYSLIQKGAEYSDTNSTFQMKSVMIPEGFNILLYPQDQFKGIPQRLSENTLNIQDTLFHLSVIKSVKIVKADEPKFSLENYCAIL